MLTICTGRLRGLQTTLGVVCLAALILFPALALALTPGGTVIPNTGVIIFKNSQNSYTLSSNTVTVITSNVFDIIIKPPQTGTLLPGESKQYTHTVTNMSNFADTIDLQVVSSLGLSIALLAIDGTPLPDTDGDGMPDAGLLAPGASMTFLIQLTASPTVTPGLTDTTVISAISSVDASFRRTTTDATAIISPLIWSPLTKSVEPSGAAFPGAVLTYTNKFKNSGNAAATHVVITDILDQHLVYIPKSERLPSDLAGISVSYDKDTRTVTWTIPEVPAGYSGKISFRASIDQRAPCDTVIKNRIGIVSDQNPDRQYSNVVVTSVIEQPLRIYKSANKEEADVGDHVGYAVRVENTSKGTTAYDVTVTDHLPKGFRYLKGSAALDGKAISDPEGSRTLVFKIGPLAPGESKTLTYTAVISIDATMGKGRNTANASGNSAGGTLFSAGPASASVKVREGVLNTMVVILGRVFSDLNHDKMPDEDEPGIKGVRIYLEDGSFAVTDGDGKYSFFGVSAGTHIVKLDKSTIPRGFISVPLGNTFAGDGGSQFIHAPFGGPARGDFGLIQDSAVRPIEKKTVPAKAAGSEQPMLYTFGTGMVAAPQTLEEQIKTMPDTPEILQPKQGDLLKKNRGDIIVRIPDGTDYSLSVNGDPLLSKQIGKTILEKNRMIRICQYVGARFVPGNNIIQLETKMANGTTDIREISVILPGDPVRIIVTPDKADIPADNRTEVPFTVLLKDKSDRPSAGEQLITVATEKGIIVEKDLDPSVAGHQIKSVDGTATFTLRSGLKTGEDTVRVMLGSTLQGKASIYFMPEMRDWIVVGVGNVLLSGNMVSGNVEDISGNETFEQGIYHNNRLAFFLKGKVLGKFLLTASYDSDKVKRDKLFQTVDPDRYYPIYGDASERGYEAESQGKLYVKIEQGKSSLLVGDFQTDLSNTELARYDRPFNGVKLDVNTKNVSVRAFESETGQIQRKDEIPGNGTSGYYFLSKKPVIENSETVRVEVRDRYHSEHVLSVENKARYADYAIDYREGSILFKEPVATLDQNLNPVFIVVNYESDADGDEYYIYGGRASVRTDHGSEVGVTAIVEQKDEKNSTLYGIDATAQIAEKVVLKGEAAWSDTLEKGRGNAWKLEMTTAITDNLSAGAYYRNIGEDFHNLSLNTSEVGTIKYGLKLNYKISDKTAVIADAYSEENTVINKRIAESSLGITHKFSLLNVVAGYRFTREDNGIEDPGTGNSIYVGVSRKFGERLSAAVLREQLLSGSASEKYPPKTLLRVDYMITDKIKMFVTQEFQETEEGRKSISLIGTESKLSKHFMLTTGYEMEQGASVDARRMVTELNSAWGSDNGLSFRSKTRYQIENSLSGENGQALLGLNTRWQISEGISVSGSAERVEPVQGEGGQKSTAFTAAIEYLKPEALKATGRYELRISDTETTNLFTVGAALKYSSSLSFLAKVSHWNSSRDTGNDILHDSVLGMAYRPLGRQSLYLLSMLRLKVDKKGSMPTHDETRSLISSTELSYRLSPRLTLLGKYAGKYSWDLTSGSKTSSYTDMLMAGATFDLTKRIDVSFNARLLHQYNTGMISVGKTVSVGYEVLKNIRVIAGYNFSRMNDRDLSGESYQSHGPFVQMQFKFDENTFTEFCERFLGACRKPARPVMNLDSSVKGEPVEVLGSVESFTLLVNQKNVDLPAGDIKIQGEAIDEIVEVKGGRLDKPVEFQVTVHEPAAVSEWHLKIMDLRGDTLRTIDGSGTPPAAIAWDGCANDKTILVGGKVYQYVFEAVYRDGSKAASPVRIFGLDRTSAVSITLASGAFVPGSAALTAKSKKILSSAAADLRKYPDEKIVIEGHADSLGSESANRDVARKRSEATAAYLIKEEKISEERIIVRWYGMPASISVKAASDMARSDGRVEIKGEFESMERPEILDQHRTAPSVSINRAPVSIDSFGRFSEKIESSGDSLAFEMQDKQGRSVRTVVPLPTVTLLTPSDEMQVALDDTTAQQAGEKPAQAAGVALAKGIEVPYSIKGQTEQGNQLKIDGREVPIGKDGRFALDLHLSEGENVFWLEIRNSDGYTRYTKLTVKTALKQEARPAREGKTSFFEDLVRRIEELYNEITKGILL